MRAPLAGLHGYLELLVDDAGLDDELVGACTSAR